MDDHSARSAMADCGDDSVQPARDDEHIVTAPVLTTITGGLIVARPTGHALPPNTGPFGSISVGGGHLPHVGAVLHIALSQPDGATIIATLNVNALREFATLSNEAISQIIAGVFDAPEHIQ